MSSIVSWFNDLRQFLLTKYCKRWGFDPFTAHPHLLLLNFDSYIIIFSFTFSSFHNLRKYISNSFSGSFPLVNWLDFDLRWKYCAFFFFFNPFLCLFFLFFFSHLPHFNFAFILSRLITFTFCSAIATILSVLSAYVCCL